MKFEDQDDRRRDHSGHDQPSTRGSSSQQDSRSTKTPREERENSDLDESGNSRGGGQQNVSSEQPERTRSDRGIGSHQGFGTDAFGYQENGRNEP